MADIIHLLPDAVANQIAAGEVVQRPASAVKELLENALDAGADDITLVVRQAGKTLIQVTDNGCGMSETDARMAFERHATSKIRSADDLFAIRTLGFRGEALASIAAIAQVELKTRRKEDETGTRISIEASEVLAQEPFAGPAGTTISVKNLFFNIPARRKFLKSDNTELKHILDEFYRVALVANNTRFQFYQDDRLLFNLPEGTRKQRIVSLLGTPYNNRLLPLELESDIVRIKGFVVKPEYARKKRGDQYFFVNGRFIRHPYLNHAVDNAFRELIPTDSFPAYFIWFDIDPAQIDINIHPTKTEVSFQNSQVIYAMLSSAVKQALGKFHLTPQIDFDSGRLPDHFTKPPSGPVRPPSVKVNPGYNPFKNQTETPVSTRSFAPTFPAGTETDSPATAAQTTIEQPHPDEPALTPFGSEELQAFIVAGKYICSPVRSGLMLINIRRAWERIFFDEWVEKRKDRPVSSQQLLFPVTLQYSTAESKLLETLLPGLKQLGFEIEPFGHDSYLVNGAPAGLDTAYIRDVIDRVLDDFVNQTDRDDKLQPVKLARSVAAGMATRQPLPSRHEEINALINRLFASNAPETAPNGKTIVRIVDIEILEQFFKE
ncbi:MAG: DNA mismatch repair endonuclease MutL [Bacteroidales bacterium]